MAVTLSPLLLKNGGGFFMRHLRLIFDIHEIGDGKFKPQD